jgi:hypothetical protein
VISRPPEDGGGAGRSPRIRPFLSRPQPPPEPFADPRLRDPDHPAPADAAAAPRPFVLTSGRVSGDEDIGLHTQVTSRIDDLSATHGLASELRAIVALCVEPMSVAEVSARLRLHLGVTKILVGDLRAGGYLDVHSEDVANPYDADTILRVIDGLRAFS